MDASVNSNPKLARSLSADELRRIDALCHQMDLECSFARAIVSTTLASGHPKTYLESARDSFIDFATRGYPIPDQWCSDEFTKIALNQMKQKYGTTEWRKAYPELVAIRREQGYPI